MTEHEAITATVDMAALARLVAAHIAARDPAGIIVNSNENIRVCLGKNPHGSSYNAFRDRLSRGEGYSCAIEENYFNNLHSFNFAVPGMITNDKFLDPGSLRSWQAS